jgi:hypothetical protein
MFQQLFALDCVIQTRILLLWCVTTLGVAMWASLLKAQQQAAQSHRWVSDRAMELYSTSSATRWVFPRLRQCPGWAL